MDWTVEAIDEMDAAFKVHDELCQKGLWFTAHLYLIKKLWSLRVKGWWPKSYRIGAIVLFAVLLPFSRDRVEEGEHEKS